MVLKASYTNTSYCTPTWYFSSRKNISSVTQKHSFTKEKLSSAVGEVCLLQKEVCESILEDSSAANETCLMEKKLFSATKKRSSTANER